MLATEWFMVPFRFLHIVAGALWFGSAFLFVAIIGPSAAEAGPSAGPLMAIAVKKRKATKTITALGMITVTAGWIMWIRNAIEWGGVGDWVGSSYGLGITIGAVLATVTFVVGYYGVGRRVERMVDLGGEIAGEDGPPTPAQQAEMSTLQAELEKHGKLDLLLLFLAVTAMATARYW